jgi:hypothetical protein
MIFNKSIHNKQLNSAIINSNGYYMKILLKNVLVKGQSGLYMFINEKHNDTNYKIHNSYYLLVLIKKDFDKYWIQVKYIINFQTPKFFYLS